MGTLSSLLGLSQNTLIADQVALNVTANNVANQNTVGYTREIVNFSSQDSFTIGDQVYGAGVSTGSGAVSVRDRILEQRVQQQTQVQAQSAAVESALTSAQDVFGISASGKSAASTALGSSIDSFFNSFSALEANPSDTPTRQSVLNAATSLTAAFNNAASQLNTSTSSLNGQVPTLTDQVNTLTKGIAALNQQISVTSPNGDAGILEDKRQALIAQLSQLIGLDQIATDHNGITLATTSGSLLVGGAEQFPLKTTLIAGVNHVLAGPNNTDVTAGLTGGSLGGTLEVRDQQIPTFITALDDLAYAIGTQVNAQNATGLDATGNPGGAIFTLPGSSAGAASLIALATNNPASIAAAAVGEGATGNSNATALAGIASTNVVLGQTPGGFYASFIGRLGGAVSSATTDNAVQQASLAQLTSQRDALSGVSLDQESANLAQYQRSYQAAAKVFQIVDDLLASAINLGVSTAVS